MQILSERSTHRPPARVIVTRHQMTVDVQRHAGVLMAHPRLHDPDVQTAGDEQTGEHVPEIMEVTPGRPARAAALRHADSNTLRWTGLSALLVIRRSSLGHCCR